MHIDVYMSIYMIGICVCMYMVCIELLHICIYTRVCVYIWKVMETGFTNGIYSRCSSVNKHHIHCSVLSSMIKCWFLYYNIALPLYWWLFPKMIHWNMHQANHFHYLTMSLLIETIAYTNIQGNFKRVCHHFASLPVAIIYHLHRLDHLTFNDILIWYRTCTI